MRMVLILCAALTLAGCAKSPQQLRATAHQASDFQLCRAAILAPQDVAVIAKDEARRRGLDCAPYTGAVLQSERASEAATNDYIRSLQQQGQRQQTPPPVRCTSRQVGNTVQTDCQ